MKPYAVRHFAATTMLANRADLAAAAVQLGHAKVATTGGMYAHVTPVEQAYTAQSPPIGGGGRAQIAIGADLVRKRHEKRAYGIRKPLISFGSPRRT